MKVPKMKNPPPPPENSMAQANANYDRWKDAMDVDKAFNEWAVKENIYWGVLPLHTVTKIATDIKAFAKFYAQRCGVEFTESINHIHLKDGVDVYKALSDFVMEKNRTLPMHDADWLEFAQYFAKRCGVVLDGNSEITNNH